jgi:hypothetical protein
LPAKVYGILTFSELRAGEPDACHHFGCRVAEGSRIGKTIIFAHRNRVTNALQAIIDESETLQKIKVGQPVSEKDIEDLCSLVLTQEPGLDLRNESGITVLPRRLFCTSYSEAIRKV